MHGCKWLQEFSFNRLHDVTLHCLKNGNEHHVFIITHILSLKQTNRYLFENGMSSKNQNEWADKLFLISWEPQTPPTFVYAFFSD